jgi:hypothetical protein
MSFLHPPIYSSFIHVSEHIFLSNVVMCLLCFCKSKHFVPAPMHCTLSAYVGLLGPEGPSKIQEVTLMRPIHGNL